MSGWHVLHMLVAANWGALLVCALLDLFSGSNFDAATVLWLVISLTGSFASAVRAHHVERPA